MSEVTVRVTSITENGSGKVNVNFSSSAVNDPAPGVYPNFTNLVLSLDLEEASNYFPGQYYTLTLASTEAPE